MELRQLEHFVAVAENGSFKVAASRCHIVQSGLSASIRALETELGTRLFYRTTRHVELTDAGSALLDEANRTLAAAAAARDAVNEVEHLLRGTLTIGMSATNRAFDLPSRLGAFHLIHPQIQITLSQAASSTAIERVATGTCDLAFVYFGDRLPDAVHAEPLAKGSMVLACSARHRLADLDEITIEDLADEDFINAPRDLLSRTVDAVFEARGVARSTRFAVYSVDTQVDLVAAGLGVAILPGPEVRGSCVPMTPDFDGGLFGRDDQRVRYVALAGNPLPWTFASVVPARTRPTPTARAFLDMIEPADAAR